MAGEGDDFYRRLRKKVRRWGATKEGRRSEYAEYILLAPDLFHLLLRLSLDRDVPATERAKIGAAIAYFVSPVDLLPEWLVGPIGYLDDVGLAIFVIHSLLENTDKAVVTRHWAGEVDLLETVRSFTTKADRMLGSGLWGRLKRLVEPGHGSGAKATSKAAGPARQDAARATERKKTGLTERTPDKAARERSGSTATKAATKAPASQRAADENAADKPAKRAAKRAGSKGGTGPPTDDASKAKSPRKGSDRD